MKYISTRGGFAALVCVLLSSSACSATGGDPEKETPIEDSELRTHGRISWHAAYPPLEKFLLIRKDKDLCAVRFTGAWRGNDKKDGTVWNSGEESFRVTYEWVGAIMEPDGRWKMDLGNNGKGQATRGPIVGVGRFGFATGDSYVDCAKFRMGWPGSTGVGFEPDQSKFQEHGYELALTKWSDAAEIDPNAAYLKWFRFENNRKLIKIPIEKFW